MSAPKAVIFGCEGLRLNDAEKHFFAEHNPWGFILFARNCEDPEQIQALTQELREAVGRQTLPILIDQEGGRVARLKPPHWRKAPPAGTFAQLAEKNLQSAKDAVYLNARLIAEELHTLGITVNCAPMADIPVEGSHDIIGDRAFGKTPLQVIELSRSMADGLLDGGVLPVLKHIPGHGRARVDSHEQLPQVDTSLDILRATDFAPFKSLNDIPLGMTAHVLYTALDASKVATLSPIAIELIRNELEYDGLLMSDDISMKALSGDLASLSKETLDAGCDLVLHCNGKMDEMLTIAPVIPVLSGDSAKRAEKALAQLKKPIAFAKADALQKLDNLLA